MRFPKSYSRAIAIVERSGGNERVGDMWVETKSFPSTTPISKIINWANDKGCSGKLIITIDESEEEKQ